MAWKVKLICDSGEELEDLDDPTFETEADAEEYGLEMLGQYRTGMRTLNMSNPGDYPLDESDGPEIYTYEA